ncbi:MerR family transcriptional regulator [Candidatus Poriferisodalis sp.]|uniref:MerR family transcriptional regulator n=1 Tax=Candidatus Poriferisodalis sp. TaxID=3101277 RepID=UPI003B011336
MSADDEAGPTLPSPSRVGTGRLSIGEVVILLRPEFSDLTDSKIRFLEDRKLISPARTPGGYRSFGPHDIEVLRWILTRQRDQYLPLSIIGERIDRGEHLADLWGIGVTGSEAESAGEDVARAAREPVSNRNREQEQETTGTATGGPARRRGASGASADGTEIAVPAGAASRPEDPAAADDGPVADAVIGPPAAFAAEAALREQLRWGTPGDARTYSAAELSAESGLSLAEVAELTDFGLLALLVREEDEMSPPGITGQASLAPESPEPRYGSDTLLIARIAREFSTYGLEARHLRVIRNAAARDAAMFEQGIQPVLHAGGATASDDARRSLGRLVALCERLRAQVMGETLRRYWA